jgi:hypothetical protein
MSLDNFLQSFQKLWKRKNYIHLGFSYAPVRMSAAFFVISALTLLACKNLKSDAISCYVQSNEDSAFIHSHCADRKTYVIERYFYNFLLSITRLIIRGDDYSTAFLNRFVNPKSYYNFRFQMLVLQ